MKQIVICSPITKILLDIFDREQITYKKVWSYEDFDHIQISPSIGAVDVYKNGEVIVVFDERDGRSTIYEMTSLDLEEVVDLFKCRRTGSAF